LTNVPIVKVSDSQWVANPRDLCSDIIHDSNEEYNNEVATPLSILPRRRILKSLNNLVTQLKEYSIPNTIHNNLRPYLSASDPTKVPNTMLDRNPPINNIPMSDRLNP